MDDGAARPVRVLVCDDEPDIRLLFRTVLEGEGADVSEVGDGDECLTWIDAHGAPDLVILDLFMPNRDGLATLPPLRRMCPTCPVLVVTAHAAVEVFEKSRARGATACFDKTSFTGRIPAVLHRFGRAA